MQRLSVVAYDEVGNEIGRQNLNAPNSILGLYPPLAPTADVGSSDTPPVERTGCAELIMRALKAGRIKEGQEPRTYPPDLQPCVG